MRRLLAALLLLPAAACAAELFNGRDFAGWTLVTTPVAEIAAVSRYRADGSVAFTGTPSGYFATTALHQNYTLHVEWRWTARPGNSGLLVHIASGPLDRGLWPRCFQIQMKQGRAGDLLPMAGAAFAEKLSTPPGAKTPQLDHAADSERPPGEWNSLAVVCRDGAIEATVNGVAQNRVTHCTPAAGQIGLQLEGAPFEIRALRIEPLAP